MQRVAHTAHSRIRAYASRYWPFVQWIRRFDAQGVGNTKQFICSFYAPTPIFDRTTVLNLWAFFGYCVIYVNLPYLYVLASWVIDYRKYQTCHTCGWHRAIKKFVWLDIYDRVLYRVRFLCVVEDHGSRSRLVKRRYICKVFTHWLGSCLVMS